MKKRPTWATVVGIMGIVFSSFGILGAGQTMMMPKMVEFQKQMFSAMTEEMEREYTERKNSSEGDQARTQAPPPKAMFETMQKMWDIPEWYKGWSVVTGLLQLLISGFYLFVCIRLLQMKNAAIQMFYFAAGAKILHGIVNGIVGAMAASFMVMSLMFWGAFGIVIHIVLLIVVVTGDKEAFSPQSSQS